eukprot:173236_1
MGVIYLKLSVKQQVCTESIMSTTDTISSTILIARKLHHCNESQLNSFLTQSVELFSKHNQFDVLKSILLKAICCNHSKIPQTVFKHISDLLPTAKALQINDSITESELILEIEHDKKEKENKNDEKKEPLTFLTIPSDLKIYLFKFLKERELYEMDKVCRSICIDSRNVNSLSNAKIIDTFDINKYTQNNRYNKIQSLYLTFECEDIDSDEDFEEDERYEQPCDDILPSTNSFPELTQIVLNFEKYFFINNINQQFNNALNLFYNLIINGKPKDLQIRKHVFNGFPEFKFKSIFNKSNELAPKALKNMKSLSIYYRYLFRWKIIFENIVNCINEQFKLDSIKLEARIRNPTNWSWDVCENVKKNCDDFEINVRYSFNYADDGFGPINVHWNSILNKLFNTTNRKYFTKFKLCFEPKRGRIYGHTEYCKHPILDFKQHIEPWLKIDHMMMKQVGLKIIDIVFRYEADINCYEMYKKQWKRFCLDNNLG